MFMIVTQQAAVHLGNDYLDNLNSTNSQPQRRVKQLFDVTKKVGQESARNPRFDRDRLARRFLGQDHSVDWRCSSVINSDSLHVLRFSIVHRQNQWKSRKHMKWENRLVWDRVHEFPRIHRIADSRRDPEHDDWNTMWIWSIPRKDHLHVNVQRHCLERKRNEELCVANSKIVAEYARKFAHGHWSFLGLGSEKKWYGIHTDNPNGKWCRLAEDMMLNFGESGHLVFRGDLKSEGKGKLSIHFCGDDETAELVLRTIIPVNQVRICRAVADMCDELVCRISGCSESIGKTWCSEQFRDSFDANRIVYNEQNRLGPNNLVQVILLHCYAHKFAILPDHLQLSICAPM